MPSMSMLSKIRDELLYASVVRDGEGRAQELIDEDNRKSAVVWSVAEIVFWLFCLALSINDKIFEQCRVVYITALVLSFATLILAAFVAPKYPKVIHFLVVVMQIVLLGVGIALAYFQPDVRSATFIASVLIVPVMFVCSTLPTMVYVAISVVVFAVTGAGAIAPDVYSWTLKSLIIFSLAGLLIGHIINKTRFERYALAESALELAELRKKYAYYDPLTNLRNRRAYAEEAERLSVDMPPACCVVSADINGLKQTNDTFGHNAGDELIIGAAECLSRCFEGAGEVFRLGGDEFCVIATVPADDVTKRLQNMEQMAVNWKGQYVNGISISYGIAVVQASPNIDSALEEADRKMYENKRRYYTAGGRDRRRLVVAR